MNCFLSKKNPRSSIKLIFIILWFCLLHGTAILLFTRGFFLTRYELKDHSDCQKLPTQLYNHHNSIEQNIIDRHSKRSCWTELSFNKTIIILIDALRFDFVLHDSHDSTEIFYRNHLPIIKHLLDTRRNHSLLYKFVADPPTTTMQRLKALTTGTSITTLSSFL
jgi:phosphatidylinositol glycan class O